MAESNPLKSAMTIPKKINLNLNDKSTFQNSPEAKGIKSQLKLEQLYTKLFKNWKGDWKSFQKKYGVLLASDNPVSNPTKKGSEWGDGQPLFKVRFVDGIINTTAAVQQQKRSWYNQIQTEGTPGTVFALDKAKNQFFDKNQKGQAIRQQIHHEIGVMELESHLEATLKKLLSKNSKTRNIGQQEYNSFSKYTHKNNIILGDKTENFSGLVESRHINEPTSAHGYKGPSLISPGTSYQLTKQSGGSIISDKAKLNLAKLSRIGTGPNTVWSSLGDYTSLAREGSILATESARTFPIKETSRSKPVEFEKIPKSQGSNYIRVTTQNLIQQGVSADKAALMAKDAYEGIRTGKGQLRSAFTGKLKGVAPYLPIANYSDIFKVDSKILMNIGETFLPPTSVKPIITKPSTTKPIKFEQLNVNPDTIFKGNSLIKLQREMKTDKKLRNVRKPHKVIGTDVDLGGGDPLKPEDPKTIYADPLTTLTVPIGLV